MNTERPSTDPVLPETEMQGARRATGGDGSGKTGLSSISRLPAPDPEVVVKASRRQFSTAAKLRLLATHDACATPAERGAFLRRNGLYSNNIKRWKRQLEQGQLETKRGPKSSSSQETARRLAALERENERLKNRLAQAQTIIDVQKKVSQLLDIPLDIPPTNGRI